MRRSFVGLALSMAMLAACSGTAPGSDAAVALDTGDWPCGDGQLTPLEDCEPGQALPATCEDLGFTGGALACTPYCTFDTSGCGCEACHNRLDDDGDGLIDCDDPDCLGVDGCPTEQCTDGEDNDGNGMADCEDPGCAAHAPGCNAGCLLSETQWIGRCGNGVDDDCDGLPDAEDPDCLGQAALLLVEGTACGGAAPGDPLVLALIVYADAGDLAAVQVDLPLPERLVAVDLPGGGTYDATAHAVTWDVGDLAHGAAARLEVRATLAYDGPAGPVCAQALREVQGAPGAVASDDPTTPAAGDPTCVRLATP